MFIMGDRAVVSDAARHMGLSSAVGLLRAHVLEKFLAESGPSAKLICKLVLAQFSIKTSARG